MLQITPSLEIFWDYENNTFLENFDTCKNNVGILFNHPLVAILDFQKGLRNAMT